MTTRIINVGLDNMVAKDEIVAIARPDSLPIKQMVNAADEQNKLIDLTRGRKRRSAIITCSGYIVLSSMRTPTLADRYVNEG